MTKAKKDPLPDRDDDGPWDIEAGCSCDDEATCPHGWPIVRTRPEGYVPTDRDALAQILSDVRDDLGTGLVIAAPELARQPQARAAIRRGYDRLTFVLFGLERGLAA